MALRASGGSSVVELLPSKQVAAGSNPVPRSIFTSYSDRCSPLSPKLLPVYPFVYPPALYRVSQRGGADGGG